MDKKTKKLWQITALIAVNLALLIIVSSANAGAVRLGGNGERVAQIQSELKKKKLFGGNINGTYDFATRRAISEFQLQNGIENSGEADFETISALGLCTECDELFSARSELLARCIYQSGCRTYPEMLEKGTEIINQTENSQTLGKYIALYYPDFMSISDNPPEEAYSAAMKAIKKSLTQ
ncbi:MAG: peptidoglycan-binding protein [Clostridia bacterium]|nr:peptidoglycan-binding protein [Clostridia bacterium]